MTSSKNKKEYLFVYGTLRRDIKNQMGQVLSQYAEYCGEGFFQGRLYDIGEYPGAIPSSRSTDMIRGEVYLLRDVAKVFKILDEYEGCGPNASSPTEFRRETVMVSMEGGSNISSWVYLYNHPIKGLKRISSGNYLPTLPAR
jgi:gamma-glutamylcyclotransferase (GGCT)/AIG2-like uncharacterized protein YtfP